MTSIVEELGKRNVKIGKHLGQALHEFVETFDDLSQEKQIGIISYLIEKYKLPIANGTAATDSTEAIDDLVAATGNLKVDEAATPKAKVKELPPKPKITTPNKTIRNSAKEKTIVKTSICNTANAKLCKPKEVMLAKKFLALKDYEHIVDEEWEALDLKDKVLENPPSLDLSEWYVSEKYDGMRGIWHGPTQTMFSKGEQIIELPEAFYADFPTDVTLDGELYIPGKTLGEISGTFRGCKSSAEYYEERLVGAQYIPFDIMSSELNFEKNIAFIKKFCKPSTHMIYTPQILATKLPTSIWEHMKLVCDAGGEGLMLRKNCPYVHGKRCNEVLKVKPNYTAEGIAKEKTTGGWNLEVEKADLIEGGQMRRARGWRTGTVMVNVRCPANADIKKGTIVQFKYLTMDKTKPRSATFHRVVEE